MFIFQGVDDFLLLFACEKSFILKPFLSEAPLELDGFIIGTAAPWTFVQGTEVTIQAWMGTGRFNGFQASKMETSRLMVISYIQVYVII